MWTLAQRVRSPSREKIHVTFAEQKIVEERIENVLEDLTISEKAVLYKTPYAEGLRITVCDALIRREPAPAYTGSEKAAPMWTLPRGMPPMKAPVP
jgi:hypothetical protein